MKAKYKKRMEDIERRSNEMKETLLDPVVDDSTGKFIGESATRNERLEAVTENSVFESAGKGAATIQGTASNALRKYCNTYGAMPGADLLASAHMAIEQGLACTSENGNRPDGLVLESALSTTEGILMRDRMVALVLPVLLHSITSRMVTHIPGTFNQSEIFKIRRIAKSAFGGVSIGDEIGYDFSGQYGSMDQRYEVKAGDGIEVGGAASTTADFFQWDSEAVLGVVTPMKKKRTKIMHDNDIVAVDDGSGNLYGTFLVGETTVTVTGTVNNATGVVNPVFSTAPAAGIKIAVAFDVDIEAKPALIPITDYEMDSGVLYPHESAISCGVTLQSLWAMRREYNLNMESMAMTDLRNLIATDKDRKILSDLRYFAKGSASWNVTVPEGLYFQEHYETLRKKLIEIDATMMNRTGKAGLSGVVFDKNSATIVKAIKAPHFVPAPGYRRLPYPHYIGRLFGMWDAYEDPQGTANTNLCYGVGNSVGEAGYVAGDCVPALPFKHPVLGDLKYSSTLWSLGYRDLNPFDGRNYFMELLFTTS
jgi:hypothetical protein